MCMGSTCVGSLERYHIENHPHVYGEYQCVGKTALVEQESPPCLWGVLSDADIPIFSVRITPMFMGSTEARTSAGRPRKNHPHVYGEYVKIT